MRGVRATVLACAAGALIAGIGGLAPWFAAMAETEAADAGAAPVPVPRPGPAVRLRPEGIAEPSSETAAPAPEASASQSEPSRPDAQTLESEEATAEAPTRIASPEDAGAGAEPAASESAEPTAPGAPQAVSAQAVSAQAVIAQAFNAEEDPWARAAREALAARLALTPIEGRARNVILMIGDGAGVATTTAIRLHRGQAAGGLGEETPLPQERFPHSALVMTYTVNAQTGDGAATATALMSGVKTKSGVLGLDHTALRGRCGSGRAVPRLGDLFHADGRAVGYVTTARLTHATPAAGYARSPERLWEHDGLTPADCFQPDIALQLISAMIEGRVQIALGGGRAAFFPRETEDASGAPGRREDGRNLLREARRSGVRTLSESDELQELSEAGEAGAAEPPTIGLFASGPMAYEHDRLSRGGKEPSLAAMTTAAIGALEAASGGRGFFLMVEGGRIGQASHLGNLHRTVTDGAAFAEAVAAAAAATDERETLIIVTADASHSLAFNGYCGRGSPVPGLCHKIDPVGPRRSDELALAADGAPFETAGFLNGPGAAAAQAADRESEAGPVAAANAGPDARAGRIARRALTAEAAAAPDHRQDALVPMTTETLSAADVAAYARGPWAHLLGGVVEQHYLFHVMRHAAFAEAEAGPAE